MTGGNVDAVAVEGIDDGCASCHAGIDGRGGICGNGELKPECVGPRLSSSAFSDLSSC